MRRLRLAVRPIRATPIRATRTCATRTRLGRVAAVGLCAVLSAATPASAMVGPDAPPSRADQAATWASSAAPAEGPAVPDSAPLLALGPRMVEVPSGVNRATPRARWAWPLVPRPAVVAPFRPPSTAYGPGHRGIDLAASPGGTVRAVAAGQVSFAGVIGGKPTLAVMHADGIRSTYEPVVASVGTGDVVTVGQPLGVVAAAGSHCAQTCVHLGAIRGSTYLDPLLLLGWWRVRLLPLDPPG